MSPDCPYCAGPSELADSAEIYGRPYGPIYICRPCRAWVGVHKNTAHYVWPVPLGRLANDQLRKLKMRAHQAFDPFWRVAMRKYGIGKGKARSMGYRWLATKMGMPAQECHIGQFDEEQCLQAISICDGYRAEQETKRKELNCQTVSDDMAQKKENVSSETSP